MSAPTDSLQHQTNELLQRILTAVQPAKPRRGFEIACAIVLSLTTTASAWSAYQSKLWGGEQMARSGVAAAASREEAVSSLAAVQARAFDASMFISYMQFKMQKNEAMEAFLIQRFRPEMKPALEAWLKMDEINGASTPLSPLQMPEYIQEEATEAARRDAVAAEAQIAARQARQFSDNDVLLTVLFAAVLFFGGISRAFASRRLQSALALLRIVLFLVTVAGLVTMPVGHG